MWALQSKVNLTLLAWCGPNLIGSNMSLTWLIGLKWPYSTSSEVHLIYFYLRFAWLDSWWIQINLTLCESIGHDSTLAWLNLAWFMIESTLSNICSNKFIKMWTLSILASLESSSVKLEWPTLLGLYSTLLSWPIWLTRNRPIIYLTWLDLSVIHLRQHESHSPT